jgi:hypothetical protein
LMFALNCAVLQKTAPKIVQIDGKSYDLMVLKTINRDGSLETVYNLGDNEPQPFLVIKIDGVYFACIASISTNGETLYFKGSEINIKKTLKDEPLQKVEPVEVISYRRFKLNEDRTEVMEDMPSLVAPDYDELVSEVATIFPYTDSANRGKEYTVQVSYDILKQAGIDLDILGKNFEMFKAYNTQGGAKEGWGSSFCNIVVKFGGDGMALEDENGNKLLTSINVNGDEYHLKEGFDSKKVQDFVEQILFADKLRKEDEVLNAECLDPMMGITTKTKNSQIAYINAYLGQNVFSHADESSNKNPEPFVRGNYTVILPNNKVTILEDYKQICEFISQKRRDGYPLQINPFWFWLRDSGGNLFIPPEEKQFSFDDFSKARKDALQEGKAHHPDRKIYERFIDLLHLETSPSLHYVNDSPEEFKGMKDRLYNKYEGYREAQIKFLIEDMGKLSDESIKADIYRRSSPMVKVFDQYKKWREVQKKEHVPNSAAQLLPSETRQLVFNEDIIIQPATK